jgi:hypothetical protein
VALLKMNRICWIPFGIQNRTFGPYLAAMRRILNPVAPKWLSSLQQLSASMAGAQVCWGLGSGFMVDGLGFVGDLGGGVNLGLLEATRALCALGEGGGGGDCTRLRATYRPAGGLPPFDCRQVSVPAAADPKELPSVPVCPCV